MREIIASANLIVGNDGSTTANNSSIGLSTDEDRLRFQQLRSKSDLILIGGNTARREPYKRTLSPLYILTHAKVRLQPKNQLAKQFSMNITELFSEISKNAFVACGQTVLVYSLQTGLLLQALKPDTPSGNVVCLYLKDYTLFTICLKAYLTQWDTNSLQMLS